MRLLLLVVVLTVISALSPSDRVLFEKMLDSKDERINWNWYVLEKGMVIKENYLIMSGKDSYCLVEYKILRKQMDNTFKVVDKFTEKQFDYTICKVGLSGKNYNPRTIIYGRVLQVKGKVLFCPDQKKILKLYGSKGFIRVERKFAE